MVVDCWFDPSCPYTWLTACWLREVEQVRPVRARWHVMSLAVLNEGRDDDPEGDPEGWLWQPVRLFAVVGERYGQDSLAALYRSYGEAVHERGEWPDVPGLLARLGLPADLAAVMGSAGSDDVVRASHAAGVRLVGPHVGTPIVAVEGPDARRTAWFGPVVSRVPRGEAAGRLWDGTLLVTATEGFHELKGRPHAEPRTG
ncbi:DsbA family protein [Geodermatophilus sabuli]|uniref:DsbA family protein n=1 Tax=Geodermatophilus sabuli TaxID=1564158 RepID=A0A7K3W4Y3_9ACTN|nr:DsbA family protein [Geodermatophilus sabuli]